MIATILTEIFERDLLLIIDNIKSYSDKNALWRVEGGITNSGGNLCLHVAGNLQHFIGVVLGGTDYGRDRPAEFARKDVPAATLIQEIENTIEIIKEVIPSLNQEDLEKDFPIEVLNKKTSTGFFLIHLATHLNYHLGQLNYHRRMIGR